MVIYKTTNLVNGKIYVGKDAANNPTYLGSGLILKRAIRKYGAQNFHKDILEVCSDKPQLDAREVFWIKELNATDGRIGYNIAVGGSGGDTFTNLSPQKKKLAVAKREESRAKWCNEDYKKGARERSKKMWDNPAHRDHMTKIMIGREITWKNKISKSITEWHKTNPIPKESTERANKLRRQKMLGREFKSLPQEVEDKIIQMYQTIGSKRISQQLNVSPYLINRVLKRAGVYQKWQKGLGNSA